MAALADAAMAAAVSTTVSWKTSGVKLEMLAIWAAAAAVI